MTPSPAQNINCTKKALVELVLKIAVVEKIYLLGKCLYRQRKESIFLHNATGCEQVAHYYLLVLVNKNVPYNNDDLQDRIENNCRNIIPVTAIILYMEQFLNLLDEGKFFALKVLTGAEQLYTATDLTITGNNVLQQTVKQKEANNYWTETYNSANEFIQGAQLYLLRQQNKMLLFMLRQATILLLGSIFSKRSGLTMHTRNLDKLLRYCSMVADEIPGIFPRDSDSEKRLFRLLLNKKGKEDLVIRRNEADILMERVKQLQEIYAAAAQAG